MDLDLVNENTTYFVTAAFTDQDGAPVRPDSGTYSIIDERSGAEILGATAFSPSSSTHEFEVTAEQNAILNGRNCFEERILSLAFDYGSGKQGTAQFRWAVKNLQGYPMAEESSS